MGNARVSAVKLWKTKLKIRAVLATGGSCCICGYNKCIEALELHHIDPSSKEFTMGEVSANPKSWAKIIVELRKCVLLCANCHREHHYQGLQVPSVTTFNEEWVNYKQFEHLVNEMVLA